MQIKLSNKKLNINLLALIEENDTIVELNCITPTCNKVNELQQLH